MTERVDFAWEEQRKDESTYHRQFGRPPDSRVQEEVGSRNDGISNNIEMCDFLELVELCLKIQHEYRAVSVWSVFSPELTGQRVQIISHDHVSHLVYSDCQYQTLVACVALSTTSRFTCTNAILQDPV